MPTINQLINKCRSKKIRKDSTKALAGCPQKSAIVIKVYTTSLKNQIRLLEKWLKYVFLHVVKLLSEYQVKVIL